MHTWKLRPGHINEIRLAFGRATFRRFRGQDAPMKILNATYHRFDLGIAPEWFAERLREEFPQLVVVRITTYDGIEKELADADIASPLHFARSNSNQRSVSAGSILPPPPFISFCFQNWWEATSFSRMLAKSMF